MKNKKTKVFIISICATLIFTLFIAPMNFKAGALSWVESALGGLIILIADGLNLILGKLDMGIEKLIFNVEGNFSDPTILKNANLSLLSNNALSKQLMKLYTLFVYIAVTLLAAVGSIITLDFVKSANDSHHKTILKARLKKLIISIVLLTSMPLLFDEIMVINQAIIDVFRLIILDSGQAIEGAFLVEAFKEMAKNESNNIVLAIIYLVSVFINAWLIVFYMLRDLSIAILFIVSPFIAIMLPYKTDIVLKWFKEIFSNIITQAIQAFILAVIVLIVASVSSKSTMYEQIFALVAFCSFIPITTAVKKTLGLEGEFGAAKSNAGLGAVIGAMSVAGVAYAGVKNSANKVKDYNSDIGNIKSEEKLLRKGDNDDLSNSSVGNSMEKGVNSSRVGTTSSTGTTGTTGGGRGIGVDPSNKATTNRNHGVQVQGDYRNSGNGEYTATNRARQLKGMKSSAKKERNKAILGGIGGAVMGGAMALGTSAYGSPFATMVATRLGNDIGNDLGDVSGGVGTDVANFTSEEVKDKAFGKGVRYDGIDNSLKSYNHDFHENDTLSDKVNKVKNTYSDNLSAIKKNRKDENVIRKAHGVEHGDLTGRDYDDEVAAVQMRNKFERMGKFSMAHRAYSTLTYDRKNPRGFGINSEREVKRLENVEDPKRLYSASLDRGSYEKSSTPKNPRPSTSKPLNQDMPNHKDADVNTNIPKTNNIKVKETTVDEVTNKYDEMMDIMSGLKTDVNKYENNNDYLDMMNDLYGQTGDDPFNMYNEYSQLS